jgi:hypothetical protein
MNTAPIGRSKPSNAKESTPPPKPPSRAEAQLSADIANGWISSALWEIERRIDSLPRPSPAVVVIGHLRLLRMGVSDFAKVRC